MCGLVMCGWLCVVGYVWLVMCGLLCVVGYVWLVSLGASIILHLHATCVLFLKIPLHF